MSPQLQKIEEDALLLPTEEREHLVERLLQSLKREIEAETEQPVVAVQT